MQEEMPPPFAYFWFLIPVRQLEGNAFAFLSQNISFYVWVCSNIDVCFLTAMLFTGCIFHINIRLFFIIVIVLQDLIVLAAGLTASASSPDAVALQGGIGAQQQYIIYPGTGRQSKKYKFDLQVLAGPNNVKEYSTPFTGVLFWLVYLTTAQVKDFSSENPSVRKNTVGSQMIALAQYPALL